MGQIVSSDETVVTIKHTFAEYPPRGWKMHGHVKFHIKSGERVRDLIEKMNSYRSPSSAITSLLDFDGSELPRDTKIPSGNVVYYV
jgi:hypothetical protein